ncbi:MAG TPA: hypothetical protein VFQ07_06290, partial [Candidatus Polarisedimenticolia bacterium]|nr:hypothetical protein [Candidatus Polarisedimenticolia bacterium]
MRRHATLVRPVAAAAFALLAALSTGSVRAACLASRPLQHLPGFSDGNWLACDDSTGVSAFAWSQGNPTAIQSSATPLACVAADAQCDGGGVLGDDVVTIESDWSLPPFMGCPANADSVGLVVRASDGTGVTLLLSLDRLGAGMGYSVTAAHRADASSGLPFPLACGAAQPTIGSVTAGSPGFIQVTAHFPNPVVYSDCDAESLGTLYAGP